MNIRIEPDQPPRDSEWHKRIARTEPIPDTKSGKRLTLECGHMVQAFGSLCLTEGRVLCTQCRDASVMAGRIPGYWMNEEGGELKPAIERYLNNCADRADVPILRAYLRQWVCATVWDENPHRVSGRYGMLALLRQRVNEIRTVADVHEFLELLELEGIDPL